ncbi:MAG: uracil-DNA glycosylase [Varibaculum sp.]|nr:uracil-DNA glycosylase [Varibaculum sp.]
MSENAPPLSETIDPGWARALAPVEPLIHEIGEQLRTENAARRGYLPAGTAVLRSFIYPFMQVKVLIVGQDPYPTPGHPTGLSFSVAPNVRPLPRSLQNIFRELDTDMAQAGTPIPRPSTGDLSPWCEQGVMLLNRVLTVRPGAPGSHRGMGWEQVTERAIQALVERHDPVTGEALPLVAILWGRDARNLKPLLGETFIIESAHPSPLSASRGFFGSRPFSRANEYLVSRGLSPVDWRLP